MAYRRMRMAKNKDHFNLKDELNKAVGTLTEAAQKKLKQTVNPDSKINPTDPALLPYTKEVKNSVQVAQALPTTEASLISGISNTHLALIGFGILVSLYLYFKK